MPVSGTRVGPYEIGSLIGAGGMGEVYCARDCTLNRDVAIKFLLPSVAGDAARLARFRREAQVLAALNHPNIASIYGLELSGGNPALVMELVEGPTLADRLAQGGMPLAKGLPIAIQIAEALAAAHDRGIVHRDLKPANIKLRADGTVKVLDFGLAKVRAGEGEELVPPQSATVTAVGTREGLILGSPTYMSPEQARGEPVDRRTDVWAFGCVLYEILTGRRAFAGKTVSDTVVAILERDPDWKALPAAAPLAVRRLLERCLEKDQERRRRDIADIRIELQDVLSAPESVEREAPPPAWSVGRRVLPRMALPLAVLTLGLVILWGAGLFRSAGAPALVKFSVWPAKGTTFPFELGAPWPSISPDGRQLAFVALTAKGEQHLWIRSLDSTATRPLPGTEGAARPFWSPDSRSLGYFANGRLWRIDLPAGPPQVVCDAPYIGGMAGTWGDGVILFSQTGGLQRVPADGGRPALVTGRDDSEGSLSSPVFLPDGRQFLYLSMASGNSVEADVCVGGLDRKDTRCVVMAHSAARYALPGYLLFVRDSVLRAQRFDPDRWEVSGEPFTLADARIVSDPIWRPPSFSISDTGVLAYHSSSGESQLVWVNRAGEPLRAVGPVDNYGSPDVAAGEQRVLVSRRDLETGRTNLWLYDTARGAPTRFTFDSSPVREGLFSPDATRVVFTSPRDGAVGLYEKLTSGTGPESRLFAATGGLIPTSWSSDGRHIIFQAFDPRTSWDIWALPLYGDRKPFPVVQTAHGEREGHLSPNLRWIAYDASESGRREVWIQPFPPTGSRWQISSGGGFSPRWRGDSKELYYVAAEGRLTAVAIGAGSTPDPSVPTTLFQTMFREGAYGSYAVSRDGQRFLMKVPPSTDDLTPITVVLNWTAALTR